MKLGTETGSLDNHLLSRSGIAPEIGGGVTILSWTDRHPATIIEWDGKILTIQEDHAKRIDDNGLSDIQIYEYSPNPKGSIDRYKQDRTDKWRHVIMNDKGRYVYSGQNGTICIGIREKYHDFSF